METNLTYNGQMQINELFELKQRHQPIEILSSIKKNVNDLATMQFRQNLSFKSLKSRHWYIKTKIVN